MDAISHAVECLPGKQAELARLLGVTPQAVSQWVNGRRPVPPRFSRQIEEATGGKVTCHDLHPDIFGPAPDAPATPIPSRIDTPEAVAAALGVSRIARAAPEPDPDPPEPEPPAAALPVPGDDDYDPDADRIGPAEEAA